MQIILCSGIINNRAILNYSMIIIYKENIVRVYFYKEKTYFCTRIVRGVAQLASVLAWGASGRQFESDHSDF